ncbi:peptide/nickel transport system ATP-binding protein [Amycolatopsis pretoriensis]|uniref:Peptide/nickel transport system ATP-binding protein n=1 Tax=Amycolatopsis pretoriensis TaxID=218821 RepID=A0A1H5Q1A8_9PSEU|nr:ABC transporter ATP-binding protein [Amycolatopsis pretoriensis]SEF19903.1 peptide/nickel transport system ATP-binding protein [Amycolatopsis pretoriensis]
MSGAGLLRLHDVKVSFGDVEAVRGVGYEVAAGEVVAVVGESGSGKTVTAMSLLGLLPPTARVTGRAELAGRDLYAMTPAELRAVRGGEVGMVFQEPMSALNPVFTVGDQLVEAIRAHRDVTAAAARDRAIELLDLVGLPAPRERFRAYPHELSGGQLQRVVIAMAVANEPKLLIADEPTTALDVTVQAEILELLRDLRSRLGTAILLITHDMGVVADLADRVVVMHDGRVVEQGSAAAIFTAPEQDYTRQLLGSVVSLSATATSGLERALSADLSVGPGHVAAAEHPAVASVPDVPAEAPLLRVADLSVTYRGRFRAIAVRAASGVNLHVEPGEVLGLVGESGSGKSTVARAVTGLLAPTGGSVHIGDTDVTRVRGRAAKALRRRIGVVFQDPLSSLNPRTTVGESVATPVRLHCAVSSSEVDGRVAELLDSVQLSPSLAGRYPHELSGGQRQRACIARALALNPDLLVADEPTSALDVTIQAKVLDLLRDLRHEFGFACLFISHDLAVIEQLADRVAVMHRGHVVEQGPTKDVLTAPAHAYTQRLLSAAPVADPEAQRRRREAWRQLR